MNPIPHRNRAGAAWRIAQATATILAALLAAVSLYAATAFMLPWWPQPPEATPAKGPAVEAYVISNGVHTDLVLPVRSARIDWTAVFDPGQFGHMPPDTVFVAIGWGDREFFLNTPQWRDLTVARALRTLSGTGRSLVHVTWLRREDLGAQRWRVPLDAAGHEALIRHITATLQGGTAPARPVSGASYGPTDAFFEARGAYDAFTTCNTWTGQALRKAGVPVSPWTPFAANVVWRLPR